MQEFIQRHATNRTYISFGKTVYSARRSLHWNDVSDSSELLFGLERLPFTAGSYCRRASKLKSQERGSPMCPCHKGRAKIMVNPKHHGFINIHGSTCEPNSGSHLNSIHFHTEVAHVKEWPAVFKSHNITMHNAEDFRMEEDEEQNTEFHKLSHSYKTNADGSYTIHYDRDLASWMEFVARRRLVVPDSWPIALQDFAATKRSTS